MVYRSVAFQNFGVPFRGSNSKGKRIHVLILRSPLLQTPPTCGATREAQVEKNMEVEIRTGFYKDSIECSGTQNETELPS